MGVGWVVPAEQKASLEYLNQKFPVSLVATPLLACVVIS
jgi:hypothetical protein